MLYADLGMGHVYCTYRTEALVMARWAVIRWVGAEGAGEALHVLGCIITTCIFLFGRFAACMQVGWWEMTEWFWMRHLPLSGGGLDAWVSAILYRVDLRISGNL